MFFHNPPFSRAQKTATLPCFPPPLPPCSLRKHPFLLALRRRGRFARRNLRAKHPHRRRARRNGCFCRLAPLLISDRFLRRKLSEMSSVSSPLALKICPQMHASRKMANFAKIQRCPKGPLEKCNFDENSSKVKRKV